MRLVLDTNTVISGLLWQGTPGRLIDAAQEKSITLCTSASLLAELRGVLMRAKFARQLQARALNEMLERGNPPDEWNALIRQSRKKPLV